MKDSEYRGFEQGPIRPPSEAASLLIRVTRNCPWNRCSFCPVYKETAFSLRSVDHVLKDIHKLSGYLKILKDQLKAHGQINYHDLDRLSRELGDTDQQAFYAAFAWLDAGMTSIFLQDADSLVIKPDNLIRILDQVRASFPWVQRVTSYASSRTIDRIAESDLNRIAAAGLNRIHIGLESGADEVLKRVQKGVDQAMHIRAGRKVKGAGMELSEYVMPGLGGKSLSRQHAVETAKALNMINPDFIRLRTLAVPNGTELLTDWESGSFIKMRDVEVAAEILLFLENLQGISSTLQSDHILNLFQDVEGTLPQDQAKMISVVQHFLDLTPEEQMVYQVGRRLGIFTSTTELDVFVKRQRAQAAIEQYKITPENVDEVIDQMMRRFI